MDDEVNYYGNPLYSKETKQCKRVYQVYYDLMKNDYHRQLPMLTRLIANFGFRMPMKGSLIKDICNYTTSVICPWDRPWAYAEIVILDSEDNFVYFDLEKGDTIENGDVTVCSNLEELLYFIKRTNWILAREAACKMRKEMRENENKEKEKREEEKREKEIQLGLADLSGDERRKQRQRNRKRGKC